MKKLEDLDYDELLKIYLEKLKESIDGKIRIKQLIREKIILKYGLKN